MIKLKDLCARYNPDFFPDKPLFFKTLLASIKKLFGCQRH